MPELTKTDRYACKNGYTHNEVGRVMDRAGQTI